MKVVCKHCGKEAGSKLKDADKFSMWWCYSCRRLLHIKQLGYTFVYTNQRPKKMKDNEETADLPMRHERQDLVTDLDNTRAARDACEEFITKILKQIGDADNTAAILHITVADLMYFNNVTSALFFDKIVLLKSMVESLDKV